MKLRAANYHALALRHTHLALVSCSYNTPLIFQAWKSNDFNFLMNTLYSQRVFNCAPNCFEIRASRLAIWHHERNLYHCPVLPQHCEPRHIEAYDWLKYVRDQESSSHQSSQEYCWTETVLKRGIVQNYSWLLCRSAPQLQKSFDWGYCCQWRVNKLLYPRIHIICPPCTVKV